MAKKEKAVPVTKLVRRGKDGKIEARPRGRQHPDFEYGYIVGDDESTFKVGEPPKKRRGKRRGGRPKGSKNKVSHNINVKRGPGRPAKNTKGLSEIEMIVRREVDARLKAAKDAAIKAFTASLSV